MRRPFPRTPRRLAAAPITTAAAARHGVAPAAPARAAAPTSSIGTEYHASAEWRAERRSCLSARTRSEGAWFGERALAAAWECGKRRRRQRRGSAARQVGAHASGDMVRAGASSSGPAQRIGRGGESQSRPISADLGRSRRDLAAAAQRVPQKRRVDQARRDQARLVGAGGGLLQQGKGRTSETSAPRRHRYSLFYCGSPRRRRRRALLRPTRRGAGTPEGQ